MDSDDQYDAIEREHHTVSTKQFRTIVETLDELGERVTELERRLDASS